MPTWQPDHHNISHFYIISRSDRSPEPGCREMKWFNLAAAARPGNS